MDGFKDTGREETEEAIQTTEPKTTTTISSPVGIMAIPGLCIVNLPATAARYLLQTSFLRSVCFEEFYDLGMAPLLCQF
jgi:hypothetical protein